jgi:hypothetical protein
MSTFIDVIILSPGFRIACLGGIRTLFRVGDGDGEGFVPYVLCLLKAAFSQLAFTQSTATFTQSKN